MRICTFVPYGKLSEESGVIYLISRYLSKIMAGVETPLHQVVQLRCNGVFSVCDRDQERDWRRTINSCFECQREQRALAGWAGVSVAELSECLTPEDIEESKRWISLLPAVELENAEYADVKLFELCQNSFKLRFGADSPDPNNKQHQSFLRRTLLAALRMSMATRRWHAKFSAEVNFIADGNDILTAAYLSQSAKQNRLTTVFRWEASRRAVLIQSSHSRDTLECSLMFEDVSHMRADIKTWPLEVVNTIKEIIYWLNIPETVQELDQKRAY